MIIFLLKGLLIGFIFGTPMGAVGAMMMQRSLYYGAKAGLLTGLGSSIADCSYACIGVFGLHALSDLLLKFQNIIHGVGGILILVMGIGLLLKKAEQSVEIGNSSRSIYMIFSSFAVGITNPVAIVAFVLAFSWFGIPHQTNLFINLLLIGGVFAGTYLWWLILTSVMDRMRKKQSSFQGLTRINRVCGVILSAFGLVVCVQSIFH